MAAPYHLFNNADDCRKFLARGRACNEKRVKDNLYLRYDPDNGDYVVRYHNTDIVTYRADGAIVIRLNGYNTVSTRRHLNGCTPFHFWSEKWTCYVSLPGIGKTEVPDYAPLVVPAERAASAA